MQPPDKAKIEVNITHALTASELPLNSNMRLIRYASFMGGGAKGAGVAGVLDELENAGILAQLEEVAGSSVGSIVATLIAVGYSPAQIKNLLIVSVDMILLQDKVEAGWLESTFLSKMTKKITSKLEELGEQTKDIDILRPLLTLPREAFKIANTVLEKSEKIGQIGELILGENLGLWKGEVLSHLMKNLIKQKTGVEELTFKELEHLAETGMGRFKKLHITGTNITDGVLEYFNAETSPHMPIHLAVRISASYPGAFIPVILKGEDGREKMFVDGGYLENLPMKFNRPPYLAESLPDAPGFSREAIAIVFQGEEDEKRNKEIKGKKDAAAAFLATPLNQKQNFNKFAATIRIDPMKVSAMDFDISDAVKKDLIASGAKGTRREIRLKAQPLNYEDLNLEELARLKGQYSYHVSALERQDPHGQLKVVQEEFNKITQALDLRIKQKNANKTEIEVIIQKERDKMEAILARRAIKNEDLESLEESVKVGQLEYARAQENLRATLQEIKIIKESLLAGKKLLSERLRNDPAFYKKLKADLDTISNIQETIKSQKSELEKAERHIRDRKEIKTNTEKRDNLESALVEKEKELDQKIKVLQHYYQYDKVAQLDVLSPLLLAVYDGIENRLAQGKLIPRLAVLEEASARDFAALPQILEDEISELTQYEQECLAELKRAKDQNAAYAKFEQSAKTRVKRSENYSTLVEIRDELDRAIVKKTNFVSKMVGKASRKNSKAWSAAYLLVKGLAVVVMVASVIPVIGVIVGKCIARSSNPKTRRQGERVIEFFDLTDVSAKARLDSMAKVVADFIQAASMDYNRKTEEESSVLYQLFNQYLSHTGLELQDLIPKTKKESNKTYQARLQGLAEKLKKFSGKTPATLKSNENSEKFVMSVQAFLKSEHKLKSKVQTDNIRQIAEDKMKTVERDNLASRKILPDEQLKDYMKSAIELGKPFSKNMLFDYAQEFSDFLGEHIKELEAKNPNSPYLKHARKLLKDAIDERNLKALKKEPLPKKSSKFSGPLLIQKRKALSGLDLKVEPKDKTKPTQP